MWTRKETSDPTLARHRRSIHKCLRNERPLLKRANFAGPGQAGSLFLFLFLHHRGRSRQRDPGSDACTGPVTELYPSLIHTLTLAFCKGRLGVFQKPCLPISILLGCDSFLIFTRLYLLGWFLFRFLSLCLKRTNL